MCHPADAGDYGETTTGRSAMRVMVTGASGRIGRFVVRECIAAGHSVVAVDRLAPVGEQAGAGTFDLLAGDGVAGGQVAGVLSGCDAVIHLGAIASPTRHAPEVVFGNNVRATFAVLQAADLVGVRRAVIASSVSALGTAYAVRRFSPLYAPVDEAHPLLGQDPYALSKEVDERIGEMFHRRNGMTVLAYRFHTVTNPGEAMALATQAHERPADAAHLLWGYVDVRDAAVACRMGVESEGLGFEVFNVVAADTLSDMPTMDLIRRYCPDTEVRALIEGTMSAWSTEKARRLLGWRAVRSWQDDEQPS
jgi:nucleoside-diphosphate-sugar epimerase